MGSMAAEEEVEMVRRGDDEVLGFHPLTTLPGRLISVAGNNGLACGDLLLENASPEAPPFSSRMSLPAQGDLIGCPSWGTITPSVAPSGSIEAP